MDKKIAFIEMDDLKEVRQYSVAEGIEAYDLEGPPPLAGTICKIDLTKNEFRVFPFYDLINKSLVPGIGCFTEITVNLGASVKDFILGRRHECTGHPTYRSWEPPYKDYYKRCVIASNTLQTNFIRSNGFVVWNGNVVAKPLYAPGRDDKDYFSLGVAGNYTCLLVTDTVAEILPVTVEDAEGKKTKPQLPPASYGIASPCLVRNGNPVRLERIDPPFRDFAWHLIGDCVDWPLLPANVRPTDSGPTITSFTAFGVDVNGKLVMASIFEGEWGIHAPADKGILASVMAELMCSKYQVRSAILGGGAADTQQYVKSRKWPTSWSSLEIHIALKEGCQPEFRNAPIRPKPPAHDRGEVLGIRGLGAIAGIMART